MTGAKAAPGVQSQSVNRAPVGLKCKSLPVISRQGSAEKMADGEW
jgi:hypothetical protein